MRHLVIRLFREKREKMDKRVAERRVVKGGCVQGNAEIGGKGG
jgi:hypothetical protein